MQFRDVAARNLREIGKTLGVANILEGSVRREGARVVVNVQLIDALHNRHVWANRYDRTLADSLGLQGELAAEIADALRVTLSPEEKELVEKKPTASPTSTCAPLPATGIRSCWRPRGLGWAWPTCGASNPQSRSCRPWM